MRVGWVLAYEVKLCPLSNNLYTLQFSSLGDWERVMEEEPWSFKGKAVVLATYDRLTQSFTIPINRMTIWNQIHDLPNGLFMFIKALCSTVGEFVRERSSWSSMNEFWTGVPCVVILGIFTRSAVMASMLHLLWYSKTSEPHGLGEHEMVWVVEDKIEVEDKLEVEDVEEQAEDKGVVTTKIQNLTATEAMGTRP
ncbi:hypothetical protein D1007_54764 [Hordeum vulgare]|nr:hypothetical protein D1007_54764 [Hordeum vulgare]